ncbi:hypothetical protein [Kocuria tytonis]|uniref:hypothetical protein n=1 Tax=Kocuria tytonis TaxID=2054280 RepID=UPI001F1F86A9|nr:hypothetical protein [Kocuria tytonis]
MPTLLSVLAAATPAPSPEDTLRPGLDPSQVSPGLVGFLMTFVLTAAVVLLVIDFNRRNRRLRYRAQYAEQRAAEERMGGGHGEGQPVTGGAGRARADVSGAHPAQGDDAARSPRGDARPGRPDADHLGAQPPND